MSSEMKASQRMMNDFLYEDNQFSYLRINGMVGLGRNSNFQAVYQKTKDLTSGQRGYETSDVETLKDTQIKGSNLHLSQLMDGLIPSPPFNTLKYLHPPCSYHLKTYT
uniref:Uncharacterized protein n=2 Tax=Lygus hesperus TaxID=30085 RepID=A0A146MEX5_LYGHE